MKFAKYLCFVTLFGIMLCSCQTAQPTDFYHGVDPDDIETWEICPFYGELRFLILDQDTGDPLPDVTVHVSTLRIEEQVIQKNLRSGPDGLLIIHQLTRNMTYMGNGPPPPAFTFSAPDYYTQTYSVNELVAGTSYDPYDATDLLTTTYLSEYWNEELELPIYEFTIQLTPSD